MIEDLFRRDEDGEARFLNLASFQTAMIDNDRVGVVLEFQTKSGDQQPHIQFSIPKKDTVELIGHLQSTLEQIEAASDPKKLN